MPLSLSGMFGISPFLDLCLDSLDGLEYIVLEHYGLFFHYISLRSTPQYPGYSREDRETCTTNEIYI